MKKTKKAPRTLVVENKKTLKVGHKAARPPVKFRPY
jgi:hypothetical protein